jgi:prevent-host-death family protein
MRFAGIKELKHKTMDILKQSKKSDIIITAHGKPMAVLHHITEEDLADYVIENDPAFKSKIEESFAEYAAHGGVDADALIKKLEKRRGTQKA